MERRWTRHNFVVNYLSHWPLTMLLLWGMDKEKGRIIWIRSWAQNHVAYLFQVGLYPSLDILLIEVIQP